MNQFTCADSNRQQAEALTQSPQRLADALRPLLMSSSGLVPKHEQQQVSNNGRPAEKAGGALARCAASVTNTGHDNRSLKIPQGIRHPAEAGVRPAVEPTCQSVLTMSPRLIGAFFFFFRPTDARLLRKPSLALWLSHASP